MRELGVWQCWSFTSSWWFFLQSVSPVSFQDFTLGSMLSASSSHHLGILLCFSMCFLTIWTSSFEKSSVQVICPFLHMAIDFFCGV
jgi:hypothetical protein